MLRKVPLESRDASERDFLVSGREGRQKVSALRGPITRTTAKRHLEKTIGRSVITEPKLEIRACGCDLRTGAVAAAQTFELRGRLFQVATLKRLPTFVEVALLTVGELLRRLERHGPYDVPCRDRCRSKVPLRSASVEERYERRQDGEMMASSFQLENPNEKSLQVQLHSNFAPNAASR